MASQTVTTVIQSLGQHRLLAASQVQELPALGKRFPEPRALLQELHRRGWLTAYQAQQLAQGKAALVLGPYRILDRLGEGAAGQVFKAVHEKQNFLVALKVLRQDVQTDADTVGRFRREIEAVSQVAHPNIVKAYEAGTVGGHLYLAMEYVAGIDLDRLVKQAGPLPPATACEYIRQAALGLQHVHERGLVHRDIKPANLLLASGGHQAPEPSEGLRPRLAPGEVKLVDLGLARLLQPKADSTTSQLTIIGGSSVTHGTPDYLAPEQAIDLRSADIRADIYSLGCTFFYLLTGQPPFAGGTLAEKLLKHHQAEPPALTQLRPELPAALEPIVGRMLAKRPADRYQTPGEVARTLAELDLEKFSRDPAGERSPAGSRLNKKLPWPILVVFPLLLLGLAAWLLVPSDNREKASTVPVPKVAPPVSPPSAASRTIIFQGRDQVRDAVIDSSRPNDCFGAVTRDNRLVRYDDSASVFLVRFALESAALPATTQVEQAALSFFVWDPHSNSTAKVCALPLKTSWHDTHATWLRPLAGNAWLGGEHFVLAQDAGPPLGHAIVRPDQGGDTADPPIEYRIDVSAAVHDWVHGAAPNHGFAILPISDPAVDRGKATRFQIYASEHNRPEHTPKLTVRVQP